MTIPTTPRKLLTPAEVANMFRVDPKTVTRWAQAGKLTSIRTMGGHRRYSAVEVHALLGITPAAPEPEPERTFPRVIMQRAGLTGHTITVERFPLTGLANVRGLAADAGRLAVVERTDGLLGTYRHVAEDGQTPDTVEQVAVAAASILGAKYVAVSR